MFKVRLSTSSSDKGVVQPMQTVRDRLQVAQRDIETLQLKAEEQEATHKAQLAEKEKKL